MSFPCLEFHSGRIRWEIEQHTHRLRNYLKLQTAHHLEARENGRMMNTWMVRPNLSEEHRKFKVRARYAVPHLADEACMCSRSLTVNMHLDQLVYGGVTLRSCMPGLIPFVHGTLMNSAILRVLPHKVSTPFRGGFVQAIHSILSTTPDRVRRSALRSHLVVQLVNTCSG